MTPEQQRIAIAQSCGWTDFNSGAHEGATQYGRRPFSYSDSWEPPDYLNDLNAMHEVEKMLPDGHTYWEFIRILDDIVKHGPHVDYVADRASATASQRAEAFIKTIDKWTTNKPTK